MIFEAELGYSVGFDVGSTVSSDDDGLFFSIVIGIRLGLSEVFIVGIKVDINVEFIIIGFIVGKRVRFIED